jgi:sialic acid synthase SpsE
MGARILEKHFTLDKRLPGPDHVASADPRELAEYVRAIRHVERAMGSGVKEPSLLEMNTAEVARKSIVAARDLPAGRKLSPGDLACKRPGTGLAPTMLPVVEGRRLRWSLAKDSPVSLEDLA